MWAACGIVVSGCGGSSATAGGPSRDELGSHDRFDGSRWTWLETECIDGPLDLGAQGFEEQVRLAVRHGQVRMIKDTHVTSSGCRRTVVWLAAPEPDGEYWRFHEEARVAIPPTEDCRGEIAQQRRGSLRLGEELFEVVHHRSPLCGGLDARTSYRRLPEAQLSDEQLMFHYAAHFNRRDAAALAALFAHHGVLVEPFSASTGTGPALHEGREAIEDWYARAFTRVSWLAMRLHEEQQAAPGQYVLDWEYMDHALAEPLLGRNLFVIAAGEIYETELQLTSSPIPKQAPPEQAPEPEGRPSEDAGSSARRAP